MVQSKEQRKNQELQKALGNLPNIALDATLDALPRGARIWEQSIKRMIPQDTGKLRNQFSMRFRRRTRSLSVDYGSADKDSGSGGYAQAVEGGYKSHWIPIEYMERHQQGLPTHGEHISNPRGFVRVGKPKGKSYFLLPGLQSGAQSVNRLIQKRIAKAIEKKVK